MTANASTRLLRFLTLICALILAVLSLLPANEMPTTGLPDLVNHFIAYLGSAAIATAAYRRNQRSTWMILAALCTYAAILEYLQHFSPGRYPSVADFVASAIGAFCGIAMAVMLWPHVARMFYR